MRSIIMFLTSLALAVHRLPIQQMELLATLVTAGIAPVLPTGEGLRWDGSRLVRFLQPDSRLLPPHRGTLSRVDISRRGAGHPTDPGSGPVLPALVLLAREGGEGSRSPPLTT